MHKNTIITAVIALVVGIGVGYVAHSSPAQPAGSGNYARGNGNGTFMARSNGNGSFLAGTVASKDSGSITLNTRDGSSRVVLTTPATNVSKSVSGSLTDVAVGNSVIVSGTTNSDGSISASLIQLRPETRPSQAPQQ